jgi:hypothetical protein
MTATPSKKISVITSTQKPEYNHYIVSGRIDSNAYEAMLGLVNMYGYESVSSFVRSAVLEKCKGMSEGLYMMFNDRTPREKFDPSKDF